MGKILIIKGADFSQNGIHTSILTWYNDVSNIATSLTSKLTIAGLGSPGGAGLIDSSLQGKPINKIRLYLQTGGDGSAYIGYTGRVVKAKVGDNIDTAHSSVKDFTVTADNIVLIEAGVSDVAYVTIDLDSAVTLNTGEALVIEISNETGTYGIVAYKDGITSPTNIIRTSIGTRTYYLETNAPTRQLAIQYGYYY